MTPRTASPWKEEVAALTNSVLNGEASDADRARLDALLAGSPAAARVYLQLVQQEVDLWRALTPGPTTESVAPRPRRRSLHAWVALTAAVLLAVGIAGFLRVRHRPAGEATAVATLTRAVGCIWDGRERVAGERLPAGSLRLSAGLVELTFASGVVAVVEGPADLKLIHALGGTLHRGSVVIRVPEGVTGFELGTPTSTLIDRGTEFGVSVDDDRRTVVQVYAGEVLAKSFGNLPTGTRVQKRETLELRPDGSRSATPPAFSEHRFVRLLPPGPSPFRYLPPYNRSRVDSIRVRRAEAPITVDGDLGEWDPSAGFRGACDPPYGETYHLEGLMAYDAVNLYLAARVGDPFPMRNGFAPEESPDIAWKGGGLRVRLTTDPALGYPLPPGDRLTKAERRNPHFAHLLMWHHQPTGRACLTVNDGLDWDRPPLEAEAWRGAFRPTPDGSGYTLEYAIPWALLSANAPDTWGGRTLAATWQLHWGDATGRVWQGHLLEGLRSTTPRHRHPRSDPSTWGRAVYDVPTPP